jgi:signal peptide peptidase SppA
MWINPRHWFRRRRATAAIVSIANELWCEAPESVTALFDALAAVDFDAHELFSDPSTPPPPPYVLDQGVARIPIRGQILREVPWILEVVGIPATSALDTRRTIEAATIDPAVQSILLEVDSPGGTLSGTGALADAVYVANDRKPVAAHIVGQAASAAFWIASQATYLTAESDASIGSIGVYARLEDVSRAADNAGVKVHLVRAGEMKGVGEPGAPISDRQLAMVQDMVDRGAAMFREAVCRGRKMSAEDCQKLADGRTWYGAEAMGLGLIDAVSTHSAALAAMRRPNGREDETMNVQEQIAALAAQVEAIAAQLAPIAQLAPRLLSAAESAEASAKTATAQLAGDRKRACDEVILHGVKEGRIVGDMRASVNEYHALVGDDVDKLRVFIARLPVQSRGARTSESPRPPADGKSAEVEAEAVATDLQRKDPKLTKEAALARAWESPGLFDRYLEERNTAN